MLLAALTLLSRLPSRKASPQARRQYRVIVFGQNGSPVEGAVIQFCGDVICIFKETNADGVATFKVGEQKVYEVLERRSRFPMMTRAIMMIRWKGRFERPRLVAVLRFVRLLFRGIEICLLPIRRFQFLPPCPNVENVTRVCF